MTTESLGAMSRLEVHDAIWHFHFKKENCHIWKGDLAISQSARGLLIIK